jgi:tetratricopeptide (TPR) repeat protein
VQRPLWWILTPLFLSAALAALAAAPPNLGKALDAQRKLAAERPQDAAVFNDLGNLLVLAGRLDEAEEAYRHAVELSPDRASARFNLGLLLQQKGELKEALPLYEETIELQPQHAWAHYQIGTILEARGQEAKAVDAYARAFALDPQLAFPEVNPHVIDNRLVTEAMLKAYRGDYAPPQAPKVYEDPLRIAALLVPPAAPQQPGQGQEEAAAPGEARRQPAAGTGAGKGNVLREQNLERGNSAGQVRPPGVARPGSANRGQARPGGVRTWTRPEPNVGVPSEEDVQYPIVEEEPGAGAIVPGGTIYQPGLPSTGRLDVELVMPPRARRSDRG